MKGAPDSSFFEKDSTYAVVREELLASMDLTSRDLVLTATSSRRTAGAFVVRRNGIGAAVRIRERVTARVRVSVRVGVGVGVVVGIGVWGKLRARNRVGTGIGLRLCIGLVLGLGFVLVPSCRRDGSS